MLVQASVVICPPTLACKTTLEEPQYSSRTWGRIAEPLLQLPVEIRPVAVGVASVVIREPYSSQLVACSCCDPLFSTRAPDLLEEHSQLVFRGTIFVESRASKRIAQKSLRHLTTVVLLRKR